MRATRIASASLCAAVLAVSASSLLASTTYTWNPNPTGPYGLNYANHDNPTNGTLTATDGGPSFSTFDFGDGPQAALYPGQINDTNTKAVSLALLREVDFTANGYSFVSTATTAYQVGLNLSVSSGVTATWNAPSTGSLSKFSNGTLLLASSFTQSSSSDSVVIAAGTLQTLNPNLFSNQPLTVQVGGTLALGTANQSLPSVTNDGALTSAGGILTVTSLVNDGNITTAPSAPNALDGDITVGDLSDTGNFTLNGTFLTAGVNAGQIDNYFGNLSGNGAFFKTGSSELILLGNTNLTGTRGAPDMTVEAGTLAGNTHSLAGTLFVGPDATLIFSQAANGTFAGALTGSGAVDMNAQSPGLVLSLSTPSTFTGTLDVSANILLAASDDTQLGILITTIPNGSKNPTQTFTYSTFIFDGGTLRTITPATFARAFFINQNGGTIDTDSFAPTFTGHFTSSGNGTLAIVGAGTATLANTTASLNNLAVSNASLALNNTPLTLTSTATALSLNYGNLTLGNASNTTTTGNVSLLGTSTLSLVKSALSSGAATLGTASFGNAFVSLTGPGSNWNITGDLDLGKDPVISGISSTEPGVGSITLGAGDALNVSGTTSLFYTSTITINGGAFTTGGLTNSPNATPTHSNAHFPTVPATPALTLGSNLGANTTYSGAITGPGSLHKINGNTQILTGNNTYAGSTLIDGGGLTIASNTALPAASLITNNATLTIAASNVLANILSGNGTLTINTKGRLTLQGAGASKQSGLTFNSPAFLDIGAHPFILEATAATRKSLLLQTLAQVASGKTRNGGITSSTVSANPAQYAIAVVDNSTLTTPFTTFGGQPVDANSVLITPALLGDTNLDNTIDLTDLSTLLNNFGATTPNWTSGNFDNAPTIDLTDLSDVLNNFGAVNLNANAASSPDLSFPTPEPTTLLLLIPALLLLTPRRKNA